MSYDEAKRIYAEYGWTPTGRSQNWTEYRSAYTAGRGDDDARF